MAAKVPMKDIVVILPGIMGSVLQKDGKDLWNVSGKPISRALNPFGRKLEDLKLVADDISGQDIEDGIKPARCSLILISFLDFLALGKLSMVTIDYQLKLLITLTILLKATFTMIQMNAPLTFIISPTIGGEITGPMPIF